MKLEGKIKHGIALAIDHNDYVDCDVVYYGGMTIRLVNASYDDLSIAFGPVGSYVDMTQYYTKEEIDNKGYLTEHQDISGKADKVDTYTKTETDTLLFDSPSFTGTPTVPTATFGDSSQKIASTSFVSSAVANYARTRTQLSGTTFNTMLAVGTTYIFGTTSAPCTSLTITLQPMTSSATKLYEYHAIIYCANNMIFSYPSSIRIANDKTLPTFASGRVFEIDIVENVMDFNYTTL